MRAPRGLGAKPARHVRQARMAARSAGAMLRGLSTTFDVSAIAGRLDRLVANRHLRKLAIVLPLDAGKRTVVREYLEEGPPFDLRSAGVDAREVFLTDSEAIFVFGIPEAGDDRTDPRRRGVLVRRVLVGAHRRRTAAARARGVRLP